MGPVRTVIRRTCVTLIAASVAASLAGCVKLSPEDVPDWVPSWLLPQQAAETTVAPSEDRGGWAAGYDPNGWRMPYGTHGHGDEVLLLGEPLATGLAQHMGWMGAEGVTKGGFVFYCGKADGRDAASTAVEYISNVPTTTVMVFGLSPDDFRAGSQDEVAPVVERDLERVRQVADACTERGMRLVLLTAIPLPQSHTTAAIIDAQLGFNENVREIAWASPQIFVFDVYEVLANDRGFLYPGMTYSASEVRLNDVAYLEVEDALLEFLSEEVAPTD
ncbi:MAG: hypothetical protein Kow0056_01550 [Coriobacteriia bacterium]